MNPGAMSAIQRSRIPSRALGMPSSAPGMPSSAPGMPSSALGMPSSALGMPSSALGMPSSPLGMPSSALGMPSSALGMPSSALGMPSSALGMPSSPLGMPSSPLGMPSSALGIPSSALGMSSSALGMPSSPLGIPSSALGMPSSPLGMPSSALGMPSPALGMPSSALGMPSSPLGMPSSPLGMPSSPLGMPSSPLGMPSSPLGMPSSPLGMPSSPLGMPSSALGMASFFLMTSSTARGTPTGGSATSYPQPATSSSSRTTPASPRHHPHFGRWLRRLRRPHPDSRGHRATLPHDIEGAPRGDAMPRTIRAPRGNTLSCKGWVQEAAMRMLMNNLDPDVAERPADLVVYGGTGKAARDWPSFDRIVASLQALENDQTLLVQSGKPVGILQTHQDAPRVLLANSNLVGQWSNWEHFWELEKKGLMMYGQMTAGSWIYIGTQGILQGTYETFAQAGRTHFGTDDLAGRGDSPAGLGGMGGAQPLAATMNNAVFLGVEIDEARAKRRVETRYLDKVTSDLDEALRWVDQGHGRPERPSRWAWWGTRATSIPELVRRRVHPICHRPDLRARPLNGYVPSDLSLQAAAELRARDPRPTSPAPARAWPSRSPRCSTCSARGAMCSITATTSGPRREIAGLENAFGFPWLRPRLHPPPLLRRARALPVGGALGRSGRHRSHRPGHRRALSGEEGAPSMAEARERAGPSSRGCPRESVAGLWRTRQGRTGLQRFRRPEGGLGAHRHRPRPPRLRLGGQPQPRDGVHEGRLRRRRGLAASQRAGER